jgi:hypothetical protein
VLTLNGEELTFRPDEDGGVVVVDVGSRRAIHLTDADVNRLIAATGRRVSPAKARMLRYRAKASTDA